MLVVGALSFYKLVTDDKQSMLRVDDCCQLLSADLF